MQDSEEKYPQFRLKRSQTPVQVKSSQVKSISSENGYSPSKKYVYITTLSKYTTSIKLVTVISEEAVLLITKLRIGRFSKSLWEG